MATMVLEREALPEALLSFMNTGAARIMARRNVDGVVLTPAIGNDDGPEPGYIDPAGFEDETGYLNALPGVTERLLKSINAPASEFTPTPDESFSV